MTALAERIAGLTAERRTALEQALSVKLPRYVPVRPLPKQAAALLLAGVQEVLYGGAARGAKTYWLLMEALRYVDRPGYGALLLRNSMTDLALEPDGLIPLSRSWLDDTDAVWHPGTRTWKFPSGATLTFGFLHDADDHRRYKSISWQMIGIDQAEEIRSQQYLFMFSRLTRLAGSTVPIRFRATANPGGRSHDFLVERFNLLGGGPDPRTGLAFVPSRLEDNPAVDQEAYERALQQLPEVEYQQLRYGDWGVQAAGAMFKVQALAASMDWPREARLVWAWDLAASEAIPGTDPDYTVGLLLARRGEEEWVVDVMRDRVDPAGVDGMILAAAAQYPHIAHVFEQEGGAGGKRDLAYLRRLLSGHQVHAWPPVGTKPERAALAAKWVNSGRVYLCPGPWVPEFVAELRSFSGGGRGHDDQVDALAIAHNWLDRGGGESPAVGALLAGARIPGIRR